MAISSPNLFDLTGILIPKDACIVTVRTEWNAGLVDKLEAGVEAILSSLGVKHIVINVPGAVEIGFAIQKYWELNNKKNPPHAFIALGCVLRGGTPHFDYVCRSVTDSVTQLNLSLPVPVIFGVLTVNDRKEADDRAGGEHGNKGEEAAITALKMMSLVKTMKKSNK